MDQNERTGACMLWAFFSEAGCGVMAYGQAEWVVYLLEIPSGIICGLVFRDVFAKWTIMTWLLVVVLDVNGFYV